MPTPNYKTTLLTVILLTINLPPAIATDINNLYEEINRCAELHEYDPGCTEDLDESDNLAATHPEIIQQMEDYLDTARTESVDWPEPQSGN